MDGMATLCLPYSVDTGLVPIYSSVLFYWTGGTGQTLLPHACDRTDVVLVEQTCGRDTSQGGY